MNCPLRNDEGAALILDYCSRKLDADSVLSFERHLSGCEDCSRVVEAQKYVWDALGSYETLPAVSDDFDEKLWARIERAEARNWWRKLLDGPALGWSSILSWKPAMVTATACTAVLAVMVLAPTGSETGVVEHAPFEKAKVERGVDLEQVEGSIEDLDMLRQLGVVGETGPSGAAM